MVSDPELCFQPDLYSFPNIPRMLRGFVMGQRPDRMSVYWTWILVPSSTYSDKPELKVSIHSHSQSLTLSDCGRRHLGYDSISVLYMALYTRRRVQFASSKVGWHFSLFKDYESVFHSPYGLTPSYSAACWFSTCCLSTRSFHKNG